MIFTRFIDDVLRIEGNANNTVNVQFIYFFSDSSEFTDILSFIYVETTSTSRVKVYGGCGSLSLKIPVGNAQVFECLSISSTLIKLCYAEKAGWFAFTVR